MSHALIGMQYCMHVSPNVTVFVFPVVSSQGPDCAFKGTGKFQAEFLCEIRSK